MHFYAVAVGRIPGVYMSWGEAEAQIRGYSGALYQKFSSRYLADQFISTHTLARRGVISVRGPLSSDGHYSPTMSSYSASSSSPMLSAPSTVPMYHTPSSSMSELSRYLTPTVFAKDTVFTDGSFAEGLAGYGWVFIPKYADVHALTGSGPVRGKLTNNTGELTAILDAITTVTVRPLDIYSDSKYSINCLTEWYPAWERNGFRTAKGQPVANLELIQAIRARMMDGISFHHVRAHVGHKWNEMADRLADAGRTMSN